MIGDGWDGEPAVRPGPPEGAADRRRVAVVTGTRAEFGLLKPVMRAIADHPALHLQVVAAGSHLVSPGETYRDVKAHFEAHIAGLVPMQTAGRTGRVEDCESLGKGVARFARCFERINPHWVLVLGDRIEAFAAAIAASVGGWALAHVHGGDRAEGIADESMRHAITKLAHLHLPATEQSAERIRRMGERPDLVMVVGSPAMDGLADIPPLSEADYKGLGSPRAVILMHPIGRPAEHEEADARAVIDSVAQLGALALHPNLDAGREGIVRAIEQSGVRSATHLSRERFIGLLKRVRDAGGLLIGNSSAALIESAGLGVSVVDVGPRQRGRERPPHVIHEEHASPERLAVAVARALAPRTPGEHPYGDGNAGPRIAHALAHTDPRRAELLRKLCRY